VIKLPKNKESKKSNVKSLQHSISFDDNFLRQKDLEEKQISRREIFPELNKKKYLKARKGKKTKPQVEKTPETANSQSQAPQKIGEKRRPLARQNSLPNNMGVPYKPNEPDSFKNPLNKLPLDKIKELKKAGVILYNLVRKELPTLRIIIDRIRPLSKLTSSRDLLPTILIAEQQNKMPFVTELSKRLSNEDKKILSMLKKDSNKVLDKAIELKDPSLANLALNQRANPDISLSKGSGTLLEKAFKKFKSNDLNSYKVVELLYENSKLKNIPIMSDPNIVLYIAVKNQNFDLADHALKKGATPDSFIKFANDANNNKQAQMTTPLSQALKILRENSQDSGKRSTAIKMLNLLTYRSGNTKQKTEISNEIRTLNVDAKKDNNRKNKMSVHFSL
jgi:hypothetical protein